MPCSCHRASLLVRRTGVAIAFSVLLSAAGPPLRVSLPTAFPMGYRDAAGKPQGFLVDALDTAAQRAGLALDWRIVGDMQANNDALRRGAIDIVPGVDSADRRREFFVSEPWWSSDLVLLVPARAAIRRESDLAGLRLAIPSGAGADLVRHYAGSRVVSVPSAVGAAEAVCGGAADAAVIAALYMRELLFAASPVCNGFRLATLDSTARVDYVIVARPAAARAARALKSALDAITADGTLASIAARHPPVSTPQATRLEELLRIRYERRIWAIATAAAALIMLLGVAFIVKQVRARKRLDDANARLRRDLAARECAETALRDSEARFRALFDSAPQTVLAIDRSGAVVFANRRATEMFGRGSLIGTPAASLLPERFRDSFRAASETHDAAGLRAGGAEFPIEIRWAAVGAGEGLSLAFITDISDRVALQQQLLQSQKLESVGQLAGGVAHDFNNLLTVITGYARMVLDDTAPDDPLREPLLEISQAAGRAAALTTQLLAFSRRQRAVPRLLTLPVLLRDLDKMLRRLIGENIELILSAENRALVRADRGQIEQVVMNLAVNARDAMPDGGRLVIETVDWRIGPGASGGPPDLPPGDYVMLRVADTGEGITPEVQAHIFEPFFTTKEQGKGTGLGLSTVYGIVKQSGGEVMVESRPGCGATFKILLPAAEGVLQEEPEARPAPDSSGHETILVAEDEPGVRKFVKRILTGHGYTVLEAANGREAVEIAQAHTAPIHLLVTDLIMPELGGIALAECVRQLHPSAAILHISGYDDQLPPGAESLMEKPFTAAALLLRVREMLASREAPRPPAIGS